MILKMVSYVVLGFFVGGFGTLIGAGGGFLLTPVLLILFPDMPAQSVTAISMTTVFFNSVSGSLAYARMKRIDFKTGLIFAAAALPGTVIGTLLTSVTPRRLFDTIFGGCMVLFALLIFMKSRIGDHHAEYDKLGIFRAQRIFTDRDGTQTAFSFNLLAGVFISIGVGFLSGFLGIGGGIVHVPALIFLGFPAHFATATSHFVLACSSFTGFAVHLFSGALNHNELLAFGIAAGAVAGAQVGAVISKKVKGSAIMICLAAALILAGARILVTGILGK